MPSDESAPRHDESDDRPPDAVPRPRDRPRESDPEHGSRPETDEPRLSRRRLLAGAGAAASTGLTGCGGRLPGGPPARVDSVGEVEDGRVVWRYPAGAIEGDEDDGIGYASVRFRVFDALGGESDAVAPVLRFDCNSTVGRIAAGRGYRGYEADRFRFRIGVPRTYEDVAGLAALVRPPAWPEVRTTFDYRDAVRELDLLVPRVNSDGTIKVGGRLRPTRAVLPRQLFCSFEVRASRPGPVGRSVVADGRETIDLSTLDLPDGVTLV